MDSRSENEQHSNRTRNLKKKSFKGQSEGGDEEQMLSHSDVELALTGLEWKSHQVKRRHIRKELSGSCRLKRITMSRSVSFATRGRVYHTDECRRKRLSQFDQSHHQILKVSPLWDAGKTTIFPSSFVNIKFRNNKISTKVKLNSSLF